LLEIASSLHEQEEVIELYLGQLIPYVKEHLVQIFHGNFLEIIKALVHDLLHDPLDHLVLGLPLPL
jgi:hypothetical protein